MPKIKLKRRIIYAGDVFKALVDGGWFIDTAAEFVKNIPVVEKAVEVIRCKDCKHYNVYRLECHNAHMNGYIGIEGYCSYGERRDNER